MPLLGTYEVAFAMGGRQGYVREYLVYSNATAPAVASRLQRGGTGGRRREACGNGTMRVRLTHVWRLTS